jgi:hypothetical protein
MGNVHPLPSLGHQVEKIAGKRIPTGTTRSAINNKVFIYVSRGKKYLRLSLRHTVAKFLAAEGLRIGMGGGNGGMSLSSWSIPRTLPLPPKTVSLVKFNRKPVFFVNKTNSNFRLVLNNKRFCRSANVAPYHGANHCAYRL